MSLTTGTEHDVDHSPESDGRHYSDVELFDMGFQTLLSSDPVIWWQFEEIEVDR